MKSVRGWIGAMSVCAVGCAGPEVDPASTVLSLTSVPVGVRCVRFRVTPTGGATVQIDRGVTAGNEALVDLGALPPGPAQLSADAFASACDLVHDGDPAPWVAAPVTITLRTGYLHDVNLTFRPATQVRVHGDFVVPARSLAAGTYTFYAVMQDGTVRAWGNNLSMQAGQPAPTSFGRPVDINGLGDVVQVAAGENHACALRSDGVALCWGANTRGQLGNGTTDSTATPTLVAQGAVRYTQLTAGLQHTCAVSADRAGSPGLYCWGARNANQFGSGGAAVTAPLRALTQAPAEVRAVGNQTCVRTAESRVSCAGDNSSGLFGLGVTTSTSTWRAAPAWGFTQQFAVGWTHACAVDLAGGILCAGANTYGELGVGSTTASSSPVAVSLAAAVQVVTGSHLTCALRADGQVLCWGYSDDGAVGVPALAGTMVSTPATVYPAGSEVVELAASYSAICARKRDGTVWCWGINAYGQLGDGSYVNRFAPMRVLF